MLLVVGGYCFLRMAANKAHSTAAMTSGHSLWVAMIRHGNDMVHNVACFVNACRDTRALSKRYGLTLSKPETAHESEYKGVKMKQSIKPTIYIPACRRMQEKPLELSILFCPIFCGENEGVSKMDTG